MAIGLTMPAQWGLFLVLIKPQVGFVAVLYWLWQAYQKGLKEVLRVFGPVTLATLASFLIFGFWPIEVVQERSEFFRTGESIYPVTAIVGALLVYHAFKDRHFKLAVSASPLLTPYITAMGYSIALLGLQDVEIVIVVVVYWLVSIFI